MLQVTESEQIVWWKFILEMFPLTIWAETMKYPIKLLSKQIMKKKKTTTKNDKECIQFPFFFFLVFPCCHLCRTPALTSTKLASGMVLLYDVISTSSQVFPSSAAPHSFLFSHRSFRALHQADVKHLSKFRPVLAWLIPGPPASFIMTNCQLFYCLHRLSLPSSTGAASTGQITQLRPTVHYHACLGIRFM